MSTITTDATNATTTTISNTYPNDSPTADLHTADSHAAGTHAYDDRKNDSPNTAHHSLWALAATLRRDYTWVDSTHTFFPGQPKFHLLPDEERETVFTVAGTGFHVDRYSLVGQWGTHVDPPIHFVEGARTLDNIPVSESILPLAVLDLHNEAAQNPDLQVSVDHILEWETQRSHSPRILRGATHRLVAALGQQHPGELRRGRQTPLPRLDRGRHPLPARRARRAGHRTRNHRHRLRPQH